MRFRVPMGYYFTLVVCNSVYGVRGYTYLILHARLVAGIILSRLLHYIGGLALSLVDGAGGLLNILHVVVGRAISHDW